LRLTRFLAAGLAAFAALSAHATFRLYPPNPVAGEEFVLQTFGSIGNVPVEVLDASYALGGTKLTVNGLTTNLATPSADTNDTPYFMLRTPRTRTRNQPF